jgi:hypothetical protein
MRRQLKAARLGDGSMFERRRWSAPRPADILIIEDDRYTANTTAVMLRKAGYLADVLPDGNHAVGAVLRGP